MATKSVLIPTLFVLISTIIYGQQSGVPYRPGDRDVPEWPDSLFVPSELIDFEEADRWKSAPGNVDIEKAPLYDDHTLPDQYNYNGTSRRFQWDRIAGFLYAVDRVNDQKARWGVLENYKNEHDRPPLPQDYEHDDNNIVTDKYGVMRNQSVPVYRPDDRSVPERYGRDGSLVEILSEEEGWYGVENINYPGQWVVPDDYVRPLDTERFGTVIVVDRTNQNICMLEHSGGKWLVRSMNPATTGLHRPPYQYETLAGIFVLQDKKEKMMYLHDGSDRIAGYAPYANRFTNGAYIHGVPVNNPTGAMVEFSSTLGTTPRSHMCVRTATSHAKYIYDNAPRDKSLIIVID
ncbi:MAG: L,D-transpeptidase [Rikenellaceae bacterium]|nr:L,D-transpeptidase [Rikenellaceae bacterium]